MWTHIIHIITASKVCNIWSAKMCIHIIHILTAANVCNIWRTKMCMHYTLYIFKIHKTKALQYEFHWNLRQELGHQLASETDTWNPQQHCPRKYPQWRGTIRTSTPSKRDGAHCRAGYHVRLVSEIYSDYQTIGNCLKKREATGNSSSRVHNVWRNWKTRRGR